MRSDSFTLKRLAVFGACVLLMGLIGWIDFITGMEVNVSIFYTLPVAITTWLINPLAGMLMAVFDTVVWEYSDFLSGIQHSSLFIFFWNTFVRFSYLILVAYLLSRLRQSFDREKEISRVDPLTGLANVRGFQEAVGTELKRLERQKQRLSIIYLDCDDFKDVNDRFGHAAGDRLLQSIGKGIRAHIREYDIAGRMGGDEFAVVLPGAGAEEARRVAERIAAEVGRKEGDAHPVTLSGAVVEYTTPPATVDALLNRADALMYEAKAAGKNQIKVGILEP